MQKKSQKNGSKLKGFTLLEVIIALAIFTGFAVSMVIFQSNEMQGSKFITEEVMMTNLASLKLNEIKIDPPDLVDSLTLVPDKGKFEDHPDYSYEVVYKKVDFTYLDKILLADENLANDEENATAFGVIARRISSGLDGLVYQVKVTVSKDNFQTSLSSWLVKNERSAIIF